MNPPQRQNTQTQGRRCGVNTRRAALGETTLLLCPPHIQQQQWSDFGEKIDGANEQCEGHGNLKKESDLNVESLGI